MYFIQLTPEDRQAGVVAITRSNVRTFCPQCGSAVHVDLQQYAGEEGFRLTGSSVMCAACSRAVVGRQFLDRLSVALAGADVTDDMNEEDESDE